jgi:hypothetical protein
MNFKGTLYRLASVAVLATMVVGVGALPASAGDGNGYPPGAVKNWSDGYRAKAEVYRQQQHSRMPTHSWSPAAVKAWSDSYRAKANVYQQQLATAHSMPPAAIATWSESYRAKADVYQRQQLDRAERAASAFHWGDALVGGGVVLALGALTLAVFFGLRGSRLAKPVTS